MDKQQNKNKYKPKEVKAVYTRSLMNKAIQLPISAIGESLTQTIETNISSTIEGKCIVDGYVKPRSVKIITYSSGLIKGDIIIFNVVFECFVCFPVAGMLLNCRAKNITKAGIRAESSDETPSPFVIFIARDHHYDDDYFNSIKENDTFVARVIAQRFELNDKYISVIGQPVKPKDKLISTKQKLNI